MFVCARIGRFASAARAPEISICSLRGDPASRMLSGHNPAPSAGASFDSRYDNKAR
jgi:hypothetical protein